MTRLLHVLCGLATVFYGVGALHAQTVSAPTCGPAITTFEHVSGLPPQVLGAIGIVESGRVNPHTGIAAPWPWTINVAGTGHVFDSAADAIAAVQAAQATGVQSIDVGCMQINLLHHPHAFATLQDAFDPVANVRYAAAFLARLHEQTGSWSAAIAAYHSSTPALGLPYARTVSLVWPLAARYGFDTLASAASTRTALEAEIDPRDVLTPEFRNRLVEAALQRRRELTDQNVMAPAITAHSVPALPRLASAFSNPGASSQNGGALQTPNHISLEDQVDPHRVLTPAFRAEMIAAANIKNHRQVSDIEGGFITTSPKSGSSTTFGSFKKP